MENGIGGLRHMLTTVFLCSFAGFMVFPVMTDVTVAAVCSSPDDSCSLAVYLTGFQQVAIGIGTMIMMPVIGNLSDRYGIKAILTIPMCLGIVPPAILGYRRDTKFFYMFYITKLLIAMVFEGTVDCLANAYVAENIHGSTRLSAFGILAGINTVAGLFGTLVARFLPVALIFQVSAISSLFGLVYMRVFLKESLNDDEDHDHDQEDHDSSDVGMLTEPILNDTPIKARVFHRNYSSLKDMISLMKTSTIFLQALIITFFKSFSDSGMESALLYFLKARFGFEKKQFADFLLLIMIVGSISQLFVLPRFASAIGERKLLSTGLSMEFINISIFPFLILINETLRNRVLLYRSNEMVHVFVMQIAIVSISWAPWVPYLTPLFVPAALFIMPSVCGIASRQVGPGEQEKVQGCISGVRSFGRVVAPFVCSPLTALFLSENAPFYFPGFSLLCISLASLIGFFQSLRIKDDPTPPLNKAINKTSGEEV